MKKDDILDDTIELLTKYMIEEDFASKKQMVRNNKVRLYKFCIKLIKLIKEVNESEE